MTNDKITPAHPRVRSRRALVPSTAAMMLTLIVAACNDDPTALDPRDVEFAAELGIDLDAMTRTGTGLYYQDVVAGTGATAADGQTVDVLYQGWLPNGTLFDAILDPHSPYTFTIGVSPVIRGWHEGIAGMRVGSVRKLVIPPSLGYGNRRNDPIPPNSVLVFEITLLSVE
ncbi:MAG: FKBP-type peptidyl-prolyl cis-trans isomerase [Longimicrobiales bacterium]